MKKIKKVVALLSIVSLLIATAFSASAVEANASYDPETNHATVLHNENQVIPVAGTTQLSQDEYKRTWASLTDNAGSNITIKLIVYLVQAVLIAKISRRNVFGPDFYLDVALQVLRQLHSPLFLQLGQALILQMSGAEINTLPTMVINIG